MPLDARIHAVRLVPGGTGRVALPGSATPDAIAPREIWNNWGRRSRLGAPARPSSPAASLVLDLRNGIRRAATFTLRGRIRDSAAPHGKVAATDAAEVVVR